MTIAEVLKALDKADIIGFHDIEETKKFYSNKVPKEKGIKVYAIYNDAGDALIYENEKGECIKIEDLNTDEIFM